MLNENIQPSSIDGIRRLASQIKKTKGLPHHQALDAAAHAASFQNYAHARSELRNCLRIQGQEDHLYLTVYWIDRAPYSHGRETLQIQLSKQILELCSKSKLKEVPGLGWFRLVAGDHLVNDTVVDSQGRARAAICKVVRALRFMEATGLKPSGDYRAGYPKRDQDNKLPKSDHATDWYDPNTGQFILIDEPYANAIKDKDDERRAWATRHGWHLQASKWPGMYYPSNCSLFAATDASSGYDFDALMSKIDAISEPLTEKNWDGISVDNHDVFLSPLAVTPQDVRRAKAKGTIWREATKTTIPYRPYSPIDQRRPNATMPIPTHKEAGRMIKSIIQSGHRPWAVYERMDSLRSTLEDWLGYECGKKYLQGPEFIDVYYHEVEDDDPYLLMAHSPTGNIEILGLLKNKLKQSYPDCAPLKDLTRKIDSSIALIKKFEIRESNKTGN